MRRGSGTSPRRATEAETSSRAAEGPEATEYSPGCTRNAPGVTVSPSDPASQTAKSPAGTGRSDVAGLARREPHARPCRETPQRCGHSERGAEDVHGHQLIGLAAAGVAHRHDGFQLSAADRRELRDEPCRGMRRRGGRHGEGAGREPDRVVGHVGVAEAVPQPEEGSGGSVSVRHPGSHDVVLEQVAGILRRSPPGLRQPAGGHPVARQHVDQPVTELLPGVTRPHHGIRVSGFVLDRIGVARDESQHRRRTRLPRPSPQFAHPRGQLQPRAVLGLAATDVRVVPRRHDGEIRVRRTRP